MKPYFLFNLTYSNPSLSSIIVFLRVYEWRFSDECVRRSQEPDKRAERRTSVARIQRSEGEVLEDSEVLRRASTERRRLRAKNVESRAARFTQENRKEKAKDETVSFEKEKGPGRVSVSRFRQKLSKILNSLKYLF